jgi:hypothetical protein
MERDILIEKRKLILEDIAFTSSRMIKDTDSPDVSGMTEVGTIWLKQLDDHMHKLDTIDMVIEDTRI